MLKIYLSHNLYDFQTRIKYAVTSIQIIRSLYAFTYVKHRMTFVSASFY